MLEYIECPFCKNKIKYINDLVHSSIYQCNYCLININDNMSKFWICVKNHKVFQFSICYQDNTIIDYFNNKIIYWTLSSKDFSETTMLKNFAINIIYDIKEFNIFKIKNIVERLYRLKSFE